MKLLFLAITLSIVSMISTTAAQTAQDDAAAARRATREKLRQVLTTSGPKKGIELTFNQSTKNEWNFVCVKRNGLVNSGSMEIVIGISKDNTIGFRIYPSYNGNYINIEKARNGAGLMRALLNLSDKNFLFWGADDGGDIFAGYTFTLESGFPDKAIEIVLYSIAPLDKFVGDMRPFIDGSNPAAN